MSPSPSETLRIVVANHKAYNDNKERRSMIAVERKTLTGLGPLIRNNLCPACHVAADADVAFCYGVAIVGIKGADAAKAGLCTKHRGMINALVHEAKHPSGYDF